MTQDDLAAAAGVHLTAVSHWELRDSLPDLDRLPAIAEALGISVTELIDGESAFNVLGQMIEDGAA